ncbi:MAG: hypothetical protein Q7V05_09915 [Methanoregula sp.]|nr:hypothetical protein [Methanoregula sp.]
MTLCEVRTIGEITIVVMPLQIDHVAALTLDHGSGNSPPGNQRPCSANLRVEYSFRQRESIYLPLRDYTY